MKTKCSHCGATIDVRATSGRKPLNHSVGFITDVLCARYGQLRSQHSGKVKHLAILQAAEELNCSKGYIYAVIKKAGLTVDQVLAGLK